MDTVLIVLLVIGFAAVVIAAYVFTVAARHYVSENDPEGNGAPQVQAFGKNRVSRNPVDRRSGRPVTFPLNVNGVMIPEDRRKGGDRRLNTA